MKKRIFLLCNLFAFYLVSFCQADIRRIDASSIPGEISELSNVLLSVRWTDSTGDHVLVSTGKTYRRSDDVVLRRAEFGLPAKRIRDHFKEDIPFVYHYMMKNDSAHLVWRTSGTGLSCKTDSKGNRIKSSFVVTDLDEDQRAEVWIVFKAVCIEDEAPNAMRLLMYEHGRRYVQTGTTVFKDGETVSGGQYWFDEAFQKAPQVFREYAHKLWQKKASE